MLKGRGGGIAAKIVSAPACPHNLSMLLSTLPIVFALMAVTAFAALGARRTGIPESIFLVLVGLSISFLPGMPRIELEPDLVLSLLLPPLLYRAGVNMSWRGFRANLRPILLLAVGLVIFTAIAVAEVSHYLLGLPLAVGFVLGAVVSPPDAVAPMAIARRFVLPSRVLTILEGEGLVNDATALILFSFAIAAVTEGGRFSLVQAGGEFLAIVVGEIAWGPFRRLGRAEFAALGARSAGGDGVRTADALCRLLDTGVAGRVGRAGHRYLRPVRELERPALHFARNPAAGLFRLGPGGLSGGKRRLPAHRPAGAGGGRRAGPDRMGAAGGGLRRGLRGHHRGAFHLGVSRHLSAALAVAGVARKDPTPPGKNTFIIAFTGIRGVVSLAAALSIPLDANGAAFPDRGLVLLATFAVILVTLVGQGFSLPWVISCLGMAEYGKKEADLDKRREINARLASIDAALARLDTLEGAVSAPETVSAPQAPQPGSPRLFRRRLPRRGAWRSLQCGGRVATAIPGRRTWQHRRSLLPGRDQR